MYFTFAKHTAVTKIIVLVAVLLTTDVLFAADSVEQRIDNFIRTEMEQHKIPGVAVAVIEHGNVILAKGFGYANLEHKVPVTLDTIFQSGSIGKQMTTLDVMLLVEKGELSLTDSVAKYLPNAPATWRDITLYHLLTHTSGIPDYAVDDFDYRKDMTEDELVKMAFSLPLEFQPGARWNYSNTGYMLLGVIVHKVSGMFYGDMLKEKVFKPLGMTTARVINEADIVPNRAAGYRLENGELKNQEWVAPSLNTLADGCLYVSLQDLIAWDKGVRKRALLSEKSWNTILQPAKLNSGNTYPYGFGWFLDERNGKPLQQHGGSWQGFKSHYARFVGDDVSIIVLVNSAESQPATIVEGITALINPALARPEIRPIDDTQPELTERFFHLLVDAQRGKLSPKDFAIMRAGFFPDRTQAIQKRLAPLGTLHDLVLVENYLLGDDRLFTYEAVFENTSLYFRVGLSMEDKISHFGFKNK